METGKNTNIGQHGTSMAETSGQETSCPQSKTRILKHLLGSLASLMWVGSSLVVLSWMVMAGGGQVTPGEGTSMAGLLRFFSTLGAISIIGLAATMWAWVHNHSALWLVLSLILASFHFLGVMGD